MALVSPGISISINDQSQYVNSNVGSVPLVVLATAQDKTYNGATASGTTKVNAGKLLSFTSQRDLVTMMGTPKFQLSSAGTPVNGSELNEYGLLTAYSALGLGNQLYAIRADIDLNQLTGTGIRPVSAASDQTYWLDSANTEFGIFVLDRTNPTDEKFTHVTPALISDKAQVFNDTAHSYGYNVPTPKNSVGAIGSYALVLTNTDGTSPDVIRLFYKATSNSVSGYANTWVQVGGADWQKCTPSLIGTKIPSLTNSTSYSFTINAAGTGTTVSGSTWTNAASIASAINTAAIPGVFATASSSGRLLIFGTDAAEYTSPATLPGLSLVDGTNSPLYAAGIVTGASAGTVTQLVPYSFYGNYAQQPGGGWFSTDSQPRPSGSIWWKTTSTGGGFTPVLKKYSTSSGTWSQLAAPVYRTLGEAIYYLDPAGGGINITHGQAITVTGIGDTTDNNLRFAVQRSDSVTSATGGQLLSATPFTAGNSFRLSATQPGTTTFTSATITLSGTGPTNLVSDILGANIPYVTATYNPTDGAYGSITITHSSGGQISITELTGNPITTGAQFITGLGYEFIVNRSGVVTISNWDFITEHASYGSEPYTSPATGTLWYYSNPAEVDIMINDGTAWKGYQNVSADARGYDLRSTDPTGVIISANAPVAQTDGTALVKGDLWLDSSDLENFPALYRNISAGTANWVAVDNTDHVTSNGIIFADARWDTAGTTDIITGNLPLIKTLLTSNYLDQDAPDYRLYPRGTLLFNTRRSGYNVKKFVKNYFNSTSFPNPGTIPGTSGSLPSISDAWVTASGLDNNGVMNAGPLAQRHLIVSAMKSAIDSNLDVREDTYGFNLLCSPGYPEVAANLINLNNDRSNTGFIIADSPMTLVPDTITINKWVNNSDGNGFPSQAASDPYTAVYYPAGVTNDLAGNTVVVPASYAALRTFLYSDNVSQPWFAPAGVHRGLVSNLSDIGYIDAMSGKFVHNGVNQGLRDALYTLKINPITNLPGVGLVIWGQETRSGSSSARSSINVVRLENYLRTIFKSISNGYLFEPNDTITRKSIASRIEGALHDVLSKRGLYDFLVICDTSNNTAATIANQQLYVDIAIEPMRDVEFIYIPIALYNPGEIAAFQTTST